MALNNKEFESDSQFYSYPTCEGVWATDVDGDSAEIEVFENDGKLVVRREELDDAGIETADMEGCDDSFEHVPVVCLSQDGEEVWEFIE